MGIGGVSFTQFFLGDIGGGEGGLWATLGGALGLLLASCLVIPVVIQAVTGLQLHAKLVPYCLALLLRSLTLTFHEKCRKIRNEIS